MKNDTFIQIKDLSRVFQRKTGKIFQRKLAQVYAVSNLNLEIKKGEILGLIGESGCGKTTTARMIMRLIKESSGQIVFEGTNLCELNHKQTHSIRKKMQMIFQDPYEALNPGMNALDIVMEPLNAHRKELSFQEKVERVKQAIEEIELWPAEDFIYRYPHQLSGGQSQRIAIARTIILEPSFIVADEPTSMLDVSVRAGVLNLLLSLKKKMGLTMLFITHELVTASYMCDRIAVMYQGKIVEIGPTRQVIDNPRHPYTKALVSVVSDLNHFIENKDKIIMDGEVDATRALKGCTFAPRCPSQSGLPHSCHTIIPQLEGEGDHLSACHLNN